MNSNSLSTSLVAGLAVSGLALAVTVVLRLRRNRTGSAAGPSEVEVQPETLPDGGETRSTEPSGSSRENRPLEFFALLFVITIPFWIFGGNPLPIPLKLPVSALAAFNPLIAALILSWKRSGSSGVKGLFRKALDYKKTGNRLWYVPILLLNPLISVLSYALLRWAGAPLPEPIKIPILTAPVLFAVFFVFGVGEELGWMGYAFDPMQNRWGALKAAILLGFVWALYHLIPDLQNQRAADWILWHRLGTVMLRILMVWVYNNTGKSVFAVILFHAMDNLSWALFPNDGSHYNPFVTCMLLFLAAAIVIFGWGAQTLARYRYIAARRS